VLVDEVFDVSRIGCFPNVIGNVESEEVTWSNKAINRAEVDMVGVEKVFARPAKVRNGFVSSIAGGLWLGSDDLVLAVGFVPGWADVYPEFFGGDEGLKLSVCSVGETIADTKGEFRTGFHEFFWMSYLEVFESGQGLSIRSDFPWREGDLRGEILMLEFSC
jgi:hypothetical protein